MTPPPSSPTWVFLNRKARVCGGEGGDSEPVLLQGADDVSLELAAPPRESVLTVSPRVLLGDVSVLALDRAATLGPVLLCLRHRRWHQLPRPLPGGDGGTTWSSSSSQY
uniref:Uncharacterized protein n=1 Tax=Oryza barthii TaxID=65489 RepID=A0A0D3ELL2_9ORYZ